MIRTGLGYDSHRLLAGRRLVLGGVEIPAEVGLDGHSDADVLTHAVIDALLGGGRRPRRALSGHLARVPRRRLGRPSAGGGRRVAAAGRAVVNVDATVVIERPRLGPHKAAMRVRLAEACGLEPESVNVKATTGEAVGLSAGGRGGGLAVATLTVRPAVAGRRLNGGRLKSRSDEADPDRSLGR